jgi:hypothetical protein
MSFISQFAHQHNVDVSGGRFAKIPLALVGQLAALDLSKTEVLIYVFLRGHANTQGRAWPANKTIAAGVRCSPRTVARAKRKLEACGLLEAHPRHTAAGGQLPADQELIADYITEALGILQIDNTEEDAFHMLGSAIADAVADDEARSAGLLEVWSEIDEQRKLA